MGFWNDLKKGLNDLGKEIKKTTENLKCNELVNKAFTEAATEYTLLGKKGVLGEKKTVLAVKDFGTFKKDLLIDSEDMDEIKVGTILEAENERYEVKSIESDKQEYYDVDIEYEVEKEVEGEEATKETVHETHQVPVTRVSVKEK